MNKELEQIMKELADKAASTFQREQKEHTYKTPWRQYNQGFIEGFRAAVETLSTMGCEFEWENFDPGDDVPASAGLNYMTKFETYIEGYKRGGQKRDSQLAPQLVALKAENEELKEYKWKYEELCK
jgi:hypothetical protein